MKRTALLIAIAGISLSASAQLSITASPYTQNFNSISSGLPTGWSTYNSATATSLGTIESFSGSVNYGVFADTVANSGECKSDIYGGGFKNYPSANGGNAVKVATCAIQKTLTADRAMGVRQVGQTNGSHPNLEPGAAFVLKLAGTHGGSNFNLQFKLQSLDTTSPRTTTWVVDYATGATPTAFTPATPVGTMTTGNLTFSNNTINVNFGTALDNKSTPVWIRIAALAASTGSGNRASTAIDDVNLTWTGTVSPASGVSDIDAATTSALIVLGDATTDKVTFGYTADAGNYTLNIYDMTGRNVHTTNVKANGVSEQITINGLNLIPGMYIAKMANENGSAVARMIVQ